MKSDPDAVFCSVPEYTTKKTALGYEVWISLNGKTRCMAVARDMVDAEVILDALNIRRGNEAMLHEWEGMYGREACVWCGRMKRDSTHPDEENCPEPHSGEPRGV